MNTDQFLYFRDIEFCLVRNFDDVTGQSAASKRNINLHARLYQILHSFRNPILKCLIQFIQRDIYDHIRIRHTLTSFTSIIFYHFRPLAGSSFSIRLPLISN